MTSKKLDGGEKATPRTSPTIIVLILGLLTSFAPFATDTYLAGFGDIARSLNTGLENVQLSLASFFSGLAIGQLFYGPISDRIGRRIPLLAGIILFTLTSLFAIFSPNIGFFIGMRFVQAVGGCAGMILSRAIIQDLFTANEMAKALSLMMVVQSLGPILAPILGGYILSFTTWHGVFIFLIGLGLLAIVATITFIPETLAAERRQHDNLLKVVKVFGQLCRRRAFIVPTIASGIGTASMFAFISGSPFVFMELYGANQQQYGWLFGLNAVGMIIASYLNRYLLKYMVPAKIFLLGIVVASVSSLTVVFLSETSHFFIFAVPLFLCLSMVPIIGANGVAIAMSATAGHSGSGSSIIGVLQFGIAALASAIVSVFHNNTAYPMTVTIFAASILAGLIYLFGIEKRPSQA